MPILVNCSTAIIGCFVHIINLLVTWFFQGIAWVYNNRRVLESQAVITVIGFLVFFGTSSYWDVHMGGHLDSENLPLGCQCHCPIAPAPAPTTHVKWSFFSNLWYTYHATIVETVYYLAVAAICFVEYMLVGNRNSDSLAGIRQLLQPFKTLGQLRKTVLEMCILRLIVFLSDVFCDPKEVDMHIFLAFICAYLHFVAIFKLLGFANDFGLLDGIVSVILSAFEHLVRPWLYIQLLGILLTSIVVCYKNAIWAGQGQMVPQGGDRVEGVELIPFASREERVEEEHH